MKKSEDTHSKEKLNDSTKLEIRDEIERRFDSPPASFVKLVEDEVRLRIRRQEWYYWIIIGVLAGAATIFATTFWSRTLSEIPVVIRSQLASEGALAAQNQITNILSDVQQRNVQLNELFALLKVRADDVTSNFNQSVASVNSSETNAINSLNDLVVLAHANAEAISNLLNQVQQRRNTILLSDIPKLFAHQFVTNLVEGGKIVLDYEPIPSTIKVYVGHPSGNSRFFRFFYLDENGYCEGNTLIFTNSSDQFKQILNGVPTGGLEIEYVRKSPR